MCMNEGEKNVMHLIVIDFVVFQKTSANENDPKKNILLKCVPLTRRTLYFVATIDAISSAITLCLAVDAQTVVAMKLVLSTGNYKKYIGERIQIDLIRNDMELQEIGFVSSEFLFKGVETNVRKYGN